MMESETLGDVKDVNGVTELCTKINYRIKKWRKRIYATIFVVAPDQNMKDISLQETSIGLSSSTFDCLLLLHVPYYSDSDQGFLT